MRACVCASVCVVICHLGSPQEGENILLPLMIADNCQREEREDSRRKREEREENHKGGDDSGEKRGENTEEGGNEGRRTRMIG